MVMPAEIDRFQIRWRSSGDVSWFFGVNCSMAWLRGAWVVAALQLWFSHSKGSKRFVVFDFLSWLCSLAGKSLTVVIGEDFVEGDF